MRGWFAAAFATAWSNERGMAVGAGVDPMSVGACCANSTEPPRARIAPRKLIRLTSIPYLHGVDPPGPRRYTSARTTYLPSFLMWTFADIPGSRERPGPTVQEAGLSRK